MGRLMIKNVWQSGGLTYFRRKMNGKTVYIRLPDPTDPAFPEAYEALKVDRTRTAAPSRPTPGTIAALIADFRESSEFRLIKSPKTKTNYNRYLDMLVEKDGHRTVKGITPQHIYKLRDRYAETPGKANNWLTVFKILTAFAAKHGWRNDNPAIGIKALPIGEHEPWPADLLRVCLEVASPMTRLLIVTGMCSGQRVSDVIRMHRGWIRPDGIMEITQQKTSVVAAIPMHPFWVEELAKVPAKALHLVYDRDGKPFGTTGAVQSRIRDLMAKDEVKQVLADLVARGLITEADRFTYHGLRKNACCYLLELGNNDSQVGSMLGMSPEMVRHYGKRARALMIARTAAATLEGDKLLEFKVIKSARSGPNA